MNHSILDMPWSENPLGCLSEDVQCTVGKAGLKVGNSGSASGYITNQLFEAMVLDVIVLGEFGA